MGPFYELLVGVLAVWRFTHLLQAEDGPWDLVVRLRRGVGDGFWGQLLDCFYCLSLWISAPAAWLAGEGWLEKAALWLAFSAGAILLERIPEPLVAPPATLYYEDMEDSDGLLRKT